MSSSSKRSSKSPKSPPPTPDPQTPPVAEDSTPASVAPETEETPIAAPPSEEATPPPTAEESASDSTESPKTFRHQPIPPPSEPRQYRAIGLVRGQYAPSIDQITRGALMASSDGTPINAVLLGRVMSLVKNHIDLQQTHLWVVYPRTGQQDGNLHVQIVGVWEPETLNEADEDGSSEGTETAAASAEIDVEDNYFSVRGEAIFADREQGYLVVKIKQAPRKQGEKPKFFKLKLVGTLPGKPVGHFWEFHVCRQGNDLVIQECHDMGALPARKPFKGGGPKRFDRNKRGGYSGKPSRYPSRSDSRGDKDQGERRSPSKPIPRSKPKEGSASSSLPKKNFPPDRSLS